MIRRTLLLATTLLLSAPALAHEHMDMMAAAPVSGTSLYNLPQTWTNQDGVAAPLAALRGQPVIVTMLYTNCREMCPLTVETMRKIGDAWAKKSGNNVHYAVFSLDSVRDTPEHLRDFATQRGLDAAQWSLFHGDSLSVRLLAAALGISYRQQPNGDFDHAYVISLLDAQGAVVYRQTGLQPDLAEWMTQLAKLSAQDARP